MLLMAAVAEPEGFGYQRYVITHGAFNSPTRCGPARFTRLADSINAIKNELMHSQDDLMSLNRRLKRTRASSVTLAHWRRRHGHRLGAG